ncbi:integrase [Streptomyces albidoflavus]|uniref:integrase n=1 Tax=Streptomyces albidoflavus TaxID=1886 RepID=UPI0021D5A552|nr:integrase [Streptomyces albidoflavus]MCU7705097.1 integrase [Streptomyces albidoflavus]
MTTALAHDDDPYILQMPAPDSPVVLPQWIAPGNTHPNTRYRDSVWSLAPLIDNPGATLISIHWKNCPAPLRDEMKRVVWALINGERRPTCLRTKGLSARGRGAAQTMLQKYCEWFRLARWLHQRGITRLADCTEDQWRIYAGVRRDEGISRVHAEMVLGYFTDLWVYDQLSARPAGISCPPWETEGIDDYLPGANGTDNAENSTEPLDPQVLGPLLIWALRFVDNFADDILAAWTEQRRLMEVAASNTATSASRAALKEYLLPLVESGAPLPAAHVKGRLYLARDYVAVHTGATHAQIERLVMLHGVQDLVMERPAPCPLNVPVTGEIEGRPWREHIFFGEATTLMQQLGTAAALVIVYLTGMRPQEVQALRSGCCPDPDQATDGTTGRYLIRSHHFKNVLDDNGNHVSAGEARDVPWVAITPVVRAIRVLERMVPEGELLLSAAHHDVHRLGGKQHQGAIRKTSLNRRIESFIGWVNREAEAQGVPDQAVPEDPHGAIGMSRFRRTLAWHVARRPGGLVALAIQYGHMRTVLDTRTSSGYASRSRRGLHSVLDVETALAAADTAARFRDRTAAGEKISGPAARRAVTAAAQAPRFEGRLVPRTFAKKATAFLARDGIVLYDNPDAFLICAFKHDNALCEPEPGATAPRQYACKTGCGNTVRTDIHARQLRARADEIDYFADHSPGPIARKLQANAARLRETAATHDDIAQSIEALT